MNLYGNLSGVVGNTQGGSGNTQGGSDNPQGGSGNTPSVVNVNSDGWYYGLEITKASDIDSCPIILPLSFASSTALIDKENFYRSANMVANVIDYGNFKEIGFHFWSGINWSNQDSLSTLVVIALPKNTKTFDSEPNLYKSTPPNTNPSFYIDSGVPKPIFTRMYSGADTESFITDKVRTNMEANVNNFISSFGVDHLPFKLKDSSDYYNTFMEILQDREFVVIRKVTGTSPIANLALSGSFYIH